VAAARHLIQHSDVNDICFGRKHRDNIPEEKTVIRFNVNKKLPKSKLKATRLLPKRIGRFYTDVTEFKPLLHAREVNPSLLRRPIIGGQQIQSSLFNDAADWGTLGAVLNIGGINYGITNFHVSYGELADGETPPGNLQMLQPRAGNFGQSIGTITNVYNQALDYSLFRIQADADQNQSINRFEGTVHSFINPLIGMKLFKFGAVTGQTSGIYDARSIIDQHRITIFFDPLRQNDGPNISDKGDSGSLWLTRQGPEPDNLKMVALHYGGDADKNVAFANLFSSIWPSITSKIR